MTMLTPASLNDAVLLNRAVYGGEFYLRDEFRNDFDEALDPPSTPERVALNVYDRYDTYLEPFGFTVLGAEDLGFAPEDSVAGATQDEDLNTFYRGGLFRNTFQELDDGSLVAVPGGAAVALVTLNDNGAGNTLNLVLRGTDADSGADGEAATGPGQVRYYGQLQPLIDQLFDYASDPANDVSKIVVSGQSLGGTAADLFTIYDGARFDALDADLEVISISSAGVDPLTLALKPDFDPALVEIDGDVVTIGAPNYYSQLTHEFDFVYYPDRYDFEQHAPFAPDQAPITAFILDFLSDNVQLDGSIVEIETPLVPIYELTADFATTFLPPHYMDLYELNGRELAAALEASGRSDFDRFVALNGGNPATEGVESNNTVNGWALPDDDALSISGPDGNTLVLGHSGDDTLSLEDVDAFALFAGGVGSDTLDLSTVETFPGDDDGFGAVVDLVNARARPVDDAAGFAGVIEVENVIGSDLADFLRGDANANTLWGGDGVDVLRGRAGDDILFGGANGDDASTLEVLAGNEGNDRLYGNGGGDALIGGAGLDVLVGGFGDDVLRGGRDRDVFVFGADHGGDVIEDFQTGVDRVNLTRVDATSFDDLTIEEIIDGNNNVTGVTVQTSDGSAITFVGLTRDDLDANDFLFGTS